MTAAVVACVVHDWGQIVKAVIVLAAMALLGALVGMIRDGRRHT